MKSALRIALAALTLVMVVAPSGPARAQFPDLDQVVKVDILPGWREDSGRHLAGLRIRLAPGWKTYWRVPGEGGIPPQFNLMGSENIAAFHPHMPRPDVYKDQGLISIGYKDEVVFPLEIRARDAQAPIHLRGVLKIGVCEAVCIPADVPLDAVLVAPGQPSASVRAALARLPERVRVQPECQIAPAQNALRLSLRMALPPQNGEYPVIETSDPETWVSVTRVWREGRYLHAVADLYPPQGKPVVFDRSGVRVTVMSDRAAQEMLGCAPR